MVVRTNGSTLVGIEGECVEIEVSVHPALPTIIITGLPGDVVKESRERIRACLMAMGFEVPSARAIVHLSPASSKKQGSQLDLGIAIALLAAEGVLRPQRPIARMGFIGELSMDGRIRAVTGALALAEALLHSSKVDFLVAPEENRLELGFLGSSKIFCASSLVEVIEALRSDHEMPSCHFPTVAPASKPKARKLDEIQGLRLAKRALQISLAGRHHLLLVGPPGVGKSMLAKAAVTLLPPLEEKERLHQIKCRGRYDPTDTGFFDRPFRSPHHTVSTAGLIGGGSGALSVGEVTLAHGGILFLDELPEFRRDALEGLREPLQNGEVSLSRTGARWTYPAKFLLIAAMNPCPCGFAYHPHKSCSCAPGRAQAYRRKISGPLYDRMDLMVLFSESGTHERSANGISHELFEKTLIQTRKIQSHRFAEGAGMTNSDGQPNLREGPFRLTPELEEWFSEIVQKESASMRAFYKSIRVARTIADLATSQYIEKDHLLEAWTLRCRDLSTLS